MEKAKVNLSRFFPKAVAATASFLLPQLLITCALANAPTFRWAQQAGGTDVDYASGLAVDGAGNAFVLGKFGANLASFGSLTVSNGDYFLAKYDPNGTPAWVAPIGFPAYAANLVLWGQLGCDAAGNVYVGGTLRGDATVVFGGIVLTNPSATLYTLFLAKYDGAGNLAWAINASGHHPETKIRAQTMAVDSAGNSYLAGDFVFAPDLGLPNLETNQSLGLYVAKFNTAGSNVWVRSSVENTTSIFFRTRPLGMALMPDGGYCLNGVFIEPTFTIGGVTLTNHGNDGFFLEMFTARFDASGGLLWARNAGGAGQALPISFGTDATGNAYVFGRSPTADGYSDTIFFGSCVISNAAWFRVKYLPDGTVGWCSREPILNPNVFAGTVRRLTVDGNGNSYLLGSFRSSVSFGDLTLTNDTPEGYDLWFLAKYAAAGSFVWAKKFGCELNEQAYNDFEKGDEDAAVLADPGGTVMVAAQFSRTNVLFDNFSLTSAGMDDVFVARVDAERPRLELARVGDLVVMTWPTNPSGFTLEAVDTLGTNAWAAVTNPVTVIGTLTFATNPITDGNRFYRLRKP